MIPPDDVIGEMNLKRVEAVLVDLTKPAPEGKMGYAHQGGVMEVKDPSSPPDSFEVLVQPGAIKVPESQMERRTFQFLCFVGKVALYASWDNLAKQILREPFLPNEPDAGGEGE